jgi:hypothetical protein
MEDPESMEPVKFYLEETFREYVKEKYLLDNPEILTNQTIM